MLQGRQYNESADVFSYAMCLVELVDRNLPWAGVAPTPPDSRDRGADLLTAVLSCVAGPGCGPLGAVPMKVSQGQRPQSQIRSAGAIRPLIQRCVLPPWSFNISGRMVELDPCAGVGLKSLSSARASATS
eukprot:COSAG01_NODE_1992_length_8696_cov_4.370827_4_plen_130_part_00